MLLQSGDDGFMNASIVLFPAWPCDWDVNAKLWGPGNTSVRAANGNSLSSTFQDADLSSPPPTHILPLPLLRVRFSCAGGVFIQEQGAFEPNSDAHLTHLRCQSFPL